MTNRRRTRNYFPEPLFQFRFLSFLVIGALIQLGATLGILYYFLKQNYDLLVTYAALDSSISTMLFHELKIMMLMIGFIFLCYLLAISCLGIIFSHRVAGPMYAIKRTLREINDGKEAWLKFRKKDEFQEVVTDFNLMLENLRRRTNRKNTG